MQPPETSNTLMPASKIQEQPSSPPMSTKKKVLIALAIIAVLVIVFLIIFLPLILIKKQQTIVFIGTNDIHGKVYPTKLFRSDTRQEYKNGGLTYMMSLMNIVNAEYFNNTIYVDGGDQFQGGIQSSKSVSSGQIMNDYYKLANLRASAIGNHQFDFGPDFLFNYYNGRTIPNLAANLLNQKNASNFMPNQQSTKLIQTGSGIKIGLIGLSTLQTKSTTAGFDTLKPLFPNYNFLDYKDVVINKSTQLRNQGAHAVVIVSHVGDGCDSDYTQSNWTSDSTYGACPKDQIGNLIDAIPAGTIDAVVQGHRHRLVHRYYNGIPYMGTTNSGKFLNFMYLVFDQNKKVKRSKIEGPIPACQKIFENTGNCEYMTATQLKTAGNLVNWKFHGKTVGESSQFNTILQNKWNAKMVPYQVQIARTEVLLNGSFRSQQSQVGNLFTNILHQLVPDADFVILNSGGFRTTWYPGIIDQEQFFNMFPFDNTIVTFSFTGKEIVDTMKILQSGADVFQLWNLQATISAPDTNNVRTVYSTKWVGGGTIDQTKTYKGVTLLYLINGGDKFKTALGNTYTQKNVVQLGEFRSLTRPILKSIGTVTSGSLIDSTKPRIIIQ